MLPGFAQEYDDKQNIEVKVTQDAHYPDGDSKLYQYIFSNVNYSEEAKANKIEGNVMVSFNVETDSTVSNVVVIAGVGHGVDEEVKRLLKGLRFAPAIQNGEATKMNLMMTFPVRAH